MQLQTPHLEAGGCSDPCLVHGKAAVEGTFDIEIKKWKRLLEQLTNVYSKAGEDGKAVTDSAALDSTDRSIDTTLNPGRLNDGTNEHPFNSPR